LGFQQGMKGFKLYDPKDKKIIISRDITSDEALLVKPGGS